MVMFENLINPKKKGREPMPIERHQCPLKKYHELLPDAIENFKQFISQKLNTANPQEIQKFTQYFAKSVLNVDDSRSEKSAEMIQLGENIQVLYDSLHPTSPFAYPMLKILSTSIPTDWFVNLTSIGRRTISRARACTDSEIFKMPTNLNRSGPNPLSATETELVVAWIYNICPVPSGSRNPRHWQYMSCADLYNYYAVSVLDDPNLPSISFSMFMKIRSGLNIRLTSYDFTCYCPYCDPTADTEEVEEAELDETGQSEPKKTLQEHLDLKRTQTAEFQRIRQSLKDDEYLLVMDFTSVAVPHAKSQCLYVNDLIITIYSKDGHDWINYMSTSADKQMFPFVEGALIDFWETYIPEHITKVIIFSDGGPHHFKIWKTINFFHCLVKLYGIPIEYSFFEAYHGSSLCDAHAGHVKRAIRALIRDGTKIDNIDLLLEKLRNMNLKNATFEKLVLLEETILQGVKKVPNLRKYYRFVYNGTEIDLYKTSADDTPTKTINF